MYNWIKLSPPFLEQWVILRTTIAHGMVGSKKTLPTLQFNASYKMLKYLCVATYIGSLFY